MANAKSKKEFFTHLLFFIVVNILLFFIDFYNLNGEAENLWWFYWTTIFWGIGIIIHGIGVLFEKEKK